MTQLSVDKAQMAVNSKNYHEGSNMGNAYSGIELEHPDRMWKMTVADKKAIYGSHRHRQGGPGHSDAVATSGEKRKSETWEPCFYRSLPFTFYYDLASCNHLKKMIHLSIGDGTACLACIELGIDIVALCLSEEHAQKLRVRLVDETFRMMQDANSKI